MGGPNLSGAITVPGEVRQQDFMFFPRIAVKIYLESSRKCVWFQLKQASWKSTQNSDECLMVFKSEAELL